MYWISTREMLREFFLKFNKILDKKAGEGMALLPHSK